MTSLPKPDYRGKVRDLYFIDDSQMIISASDRISAFDVVFQETIPGKGCILNNISGMWFAAIKASGLHQQLDFEDQLLTSDINDFPAPFNSYAELKNRSILVRRTKRIDFECVVRGYLAGSSWKDYQKHQSICGIPLPAGMIEAQKLPAPVFTPATKAQIGEHDENVSFAYMQEKIGKALATRLQEISIALYNFAAAKMDQAGILLCDTKFEFGLLDDKIILIDEALTPDSSRYWRKSDYQAGSTPPGFDKQYIRDYVAATGWNKSPPPPPLPDEIIQKTVDLYKSIEAKITKILA